MIRIYLTGIICSIALLANCQDADQEERIYSFLIDNILSKYQGNIIIDKHGSPGFLLNSGDSLIFSPSSCFFIDEKYRKDEFWNSNLTGSDLDYIYEQISDLNHFKWDAEKLPGNIIIYSKRQIRNYSKSMMNREKETREKPTSERDNAIKSINTFSVPVFNKGGNLALIYASEYSGPESASWEIRIYYKIDGNWILIGSHLLGMA